MTRLTGLCEKRKLFWPHEQIASCLSWSVARIIRTISLAFEQRKSSVRSLHHRTHLPHGLSFHRGEILHSWHDMICKTSPVSKDIRDLCFLLLAHTYCCCRTSSITPATGAELVEMVGNADLHTTWVASPSPCCAPLHNISLCLFLHTSQPPVSNSLKSLSSPSGPSLPR